MFARRLLDRVNTLLLTYVDEWARLVDDVASCVERETCRRSTRQRAPSAEWRQPRRPTTRTTQPYDLYLALHL